MHSQYLESVFGALDPALKRELLEVALQLTHEACTVGAFPTDEIMLQKLVEGVESRRPFRQEAIELVLGPPELMRSTDERRVWIQMAADGAIALSGSMSASGHPTTALVKANGGLSIGKARSTDQEGSGTTGRGIRSSVAEAFRASELMSVVACDERSDPVSVPWVAFFREGLMIAVHGRLESGMAGATDGVGVPIPSLQAHDGNGQILSPVALAGVEVRGDEARAALFFRPGLKLDDTLVVAIPGRKEFRVSPTQNAGETKRGGSGQNVEDVLFRTALILAAERLSDGFSETKMRRVAGRLSAELGLPAYVHGPSRAAEPRPTAVAVEVEVERGGSARIAVVAGRQSYVSSLTSEGTLLDFGLETVVGSRTSRADQGSEPELLPKDVEAANSWSVVPGAVSEGGRAQLLAIERSPQSLVVHIIGEEETKQPEASGDLSPVLVLDEDGQSLALLSQSTEDNPQYCVGVFENVSASTTVVSVRAASEIWCIDFSV